MQKSHKEHSKCKLAKPRVKIKSVSKHQQTTKEASLVRRRVQDSRRIAGKLAAPRQNGLTELK